MANQRHATPNRKHYRRGMATYNHSRFDRLANGAFAEFVESEFFRSILRVSIGVLMTVFIGLTIGLQVGVAI
ncbi:hypothetical protein [uncultured Paraglaciecola sp.]|uniref:hypothetical protein n=1 Tax=uncultured Paraglaciecola sp. TaxID=1765024 RepID=UPI002628AAD7|nr:hypothetical protein [uncultured Paraglaciecola sp.]